MAKRTARLYSLYQKIDGRWVKQSNTDLPKQQAIRVFQNRLLEGFFSGVKTELRPVPKKS